MIPISTGAAAVFPYSDELVHRFSLTDRFDEKYVLYKKVEDRIWLPRGRFPLGEDLRDKGKSIDCQNLFVPRDKEQERVVKETYDLLKDNESFILQARTGFGKCLRKGTLVLMYSGHVKKVEDIVNGDQVMGPDSKLRIVSGVVSGFGPMYKVTPVKGEPWYCNDVHVLSLKRTNYFQKNGSGRKGRWKGGEIVNVSVSDYLKKSNKFKCLHKLWRVGVDFEEGKKVFIDPYFMGVLLGDGGLTQGINVTTMDKEIVDEVYKQASLWSLRVVPYQQIGNKAVTYALSGAIGGADRDTNQLRNVIHYMELHKEKYIYHDYKISSRTDRLKLLAGLLDTDGHLVKSTVFEYVSKSERLAEDVCFVARSLGLAAYLKSVVKHCQNGNGGVYYRVHISGNTDQIPTRLPRKQAKSRKQKKDVLRTGFSVDYVGEDFYYGFQLDRDNLFLLGDFTVTHNTYVGMAMTAMLNVRTLVITTKEDILYQWKQAAKSVLGCPDSDIGFWRADHHPTHEGQYKVVIGLVHSILKGPDRYPIQAFRGYGLVICDEVHRMAAEQFSQSMWWLPCIRRLGMSATPYRKDGRDIVFTSHIGPVKVRATQQTVIPKVLIQKTGWKVPWVWRGSDYVKLPHDMGKTMHVSKLLAQDKGRNSHIVKFLKTACEKNRNTIVFADTIDHLVNLYNGCIDVGIKPNDLGYYVGLDANVYEGGKLDKQAHREKVKGRKVILATYAMASEATDIPWLDTAVLATPRSDVTQIIGRIQREYEDKQRPVVLDLVDEDSYVFKAYAGKRMRWYKSIGAEVVALS